MRKSHHRYRHEVIAVLLGLSVLSYLHNWLVVSMAGIATEESHPVQTPINNQLIISADNEEMGSVIGAATISSHQMNISLTERLLPLRAQENTWRMNVDIGNATEVNNLASLYLATDQHNNNNNKQLNEESGSLRISDIVREKNVDNARLYSFRQKKIRYPDDGFPQGILSNISVSHIRSLQRKVDKLSHTKRCKRYGFFYNSSSPHKRRRIFYGANIAEEPWELFEIVSAEAHGIFEGMVFVESNRTQNFVPRPFRRLHHDAVLRQLFGVNQVQVRSFVDDNEKLRKLHRENAQRYEILRGWKEMGMTPHDVGYIADPDETFSRDFLRAVQVCDGIDAFDYEKHHCGHFKVKLVSATRVFEMSPECITQNYKWFHPDMILGACIEMIGNETLNPVATRDDGYRLKGFGQECEPWIDQIDNRYPLWSPFDFRMTCGGYDALLNDPPFYAQYTGYHFHNFFADFNATRFKYFSYGHPDPTALHKPLEQLHEDMLVGIRCLKNVSDGPGTDLRRELGGFEALQPTLPLYFLDKNYRQRRHQYMQEKVTADEKVLASATVSESVVQ